MAHALGARLHIPLGIGCALVTPSVIELVAAARPDVYRKVAEIFELEDFSVEELFHKTCRCCSFIQPQKIEFLP